MSGASRNTAIAGVALSDVGRVDDKGPYELIAQASRRALADAGLTPADIDGLASTSQGTLPRSISVSISACGHVGSTRRRSAAHHGR